MQLDIRNLKFRPLVRKALLISSTFLFLGCVPKARYNSALNEADRYRKQEKALAKRNAELRALMQKESIDYNERLEARYEAATETNEDLRLKLADAYAQLNEASTNLTALNDSLSAAFSMFLPEEIDVQNENGQLRITFADQIFFKTGKHRVNQQGDSILQRLSDALKAQETAMHINVIGHADNRRINHRGIRDNWELSTRRANAVVRKLQTMGISPDVLMASGRSHYAPLAPNTNRLGRAMNRRTEIVIVPHMDGIVYDLLFSNR